MRSRLTIEMTRTAWMGSLAAVGLVLSQARLVEAQFPVGNAGDTTQNSRPGQTSSTPVLVRDRAAGQDARMLLAHALEMVIDGSNLQLLTMQPGSLGVGNPGTGTPGVPATGPLPPPNVGSPGTGFTGLPGETVSGRPVTPGTGTIAPVIAGPGSVVTSGVDGSRNGGRLATLQRQAQRTMDTGDRLLRQSGREAALDQRFLQAATAYSATLRSLVGRPAARVDETGAVIGSATQGTPAPGSNLVSVTPAVVLNETDRVSIALINHGVMEAIGSMTIKQFVQLLGSADSPAAQILLTRAREMDLESSSVNQAINASNAGLQSATVQALAQQAKELIMAMQGTVGEGNTPGR